MVAVGVIERAGNIVRDLRGVLERQPVLTLEPLA
jgi:hypothetical protein